MQSAFPILPPIFHLSNNIRSSSLSPTSSPRPTKRARTEPQSPPPSESCSPSQAKLQNEPKTDRVQPSPPTPPASHEPSTPPAAPHSHTTSQLSTPSPETFSSPFVAGSLPVTPSFDSQIARAIEPFNVLPGIGGVRERIISPERGHFDDNYSANGSPGTNSGVSIIVLFFRLSTCARCVNCRHHKKA